jgi:hypothetical protein
LALLKASLFALLSGAASEGPDYPLGPLRLPPIAEDAAPFRIADLRYSFAANGETVSSFETRVRAGGSLFVGGEVTGDRLGLFVDTQRIELGVSEEGGDYELEGSFRAPWFRLAARALHQDGEWSGSASLSARFSNDLELLVSDSRDQEGSVFAPPSLEEFVRTGVLPPLGPPNRELRGTSVGLLYQRESHLEALADARLSRVRTGAGIDLDVERYRVAALWNPNRFAVDGEVFYENRAGRLSARELGAFIGIEAEVFSHLLARASTRKRWEPGVLRFDEEYRFGATFFGRRHRFARRSEAAARVVELQRQANALGYNERRTYDLEGLRSFRERLGLSPARHELKEALDELYRAQVRARNVPQIGFEIGLGEDSLAAVESRIYRAFVGVPWPLRLPFLRNEEAVDFLQAELVIRHDDYPGLQGVSRELGLTAFLNREMSLFFRWQDPGTAPLGRRGPDRFTAGFEYAMGR